MGAVNFDIHASSRRLESTFPLHTEAGVRDFLEKVLALEELKYLAGDYDISIWLADFYEALWEQNIITTSEIKVIYYVYFEGYKQTELDELIGMKKTTVNTLHTRAITKIAKYYALVKEKEMGDLVENR